MRVTLAAALRDTLRSVRRFPGSTTLAFVIVMLSIGAATVTFSVVDTVIFRRLPFPEDHRLIAIRESTPESPYSRIVGPPEYYAWRDASGSFEALAAWTTEPASVDIGAGVENVRIALTTANLFDVLRVHPAAGWTYGEQHETRRHDNVVLISHELWQRRFARAPDAVGRTVSIDGAAATVIGVMPPAFTFPIDDGDRIEIWRPLVIPTESRTITPETGRSGSLEVIGRLREHATIDQARAEVEAVWKHFVESYTVLFDGQRVRVSAFRDSLSEPFRGWMLLALGTVGLLVLLACANVASLLLARFEARNRDLAIRSSLGATRGQLIALQLVESLVLSGAAAGAGVAAAYFGLEVVRSMLPEGVARASTIALDGRVLATASGAAILTGLLFGALPAWRASRRDVVDRLQQGSAPGGHHSRGWRDALLVGETALVSALLVITTLVVGSFVRVSRADLGFDRSHLLTVQATPSFPGLPARQRQARTHELLRQTIEVLRGVPGVTHVAAAGGGPVPLGFGIAGFLETADGYVMVETRSASPGYFETARIPLLQGRDFSEWDRSDTRWVVVIDALAARQLFGGDDPLGREVRFGGGDRTATVVGVVQHVQLRGPENHSGPQLYHPLAQRPEGGEIVIRTAIPPARAVQDIVALVAGLLPAGSPTPVVSIIEDQFRELTAVRRFNATVLSGFGLLALVIGVAGIYGVTASAVAQQTREIGIRMALGANSLRVVRSIAGSTLRLLVAGTGIGLAAAWALSGSLGPLLFGIRPSDALPYALPFIVLSCVGLLAALVPAMRAASIDPLLVLRRE